MRPPFSSTMRRAGFGRSVAIMAGGAAAAQAINALVSPLLTRLYLPAELGLLGLYLAFLYVASVMLSLRYEQAVVSAEDEPEANQIAALAIAIVPAMSLLATLVLLLLIRLQIGGFGGLPMSSTIWAFPALILFGIFAVLRYALVRAGASRVIAQVGVVQSLGRAAVQVGAGLLGAGLVGLLAGDLLGRAMGIGRMTRQLGGAITEQAKVIRRSDGRRLLWAYRKFAFVGVPSSLVNALALTLPLPLIAAFYGLEAAGYFSLVQRVLWLPIAVVGAAAADALHGRLAQHAREAPERALSLFDRAGVGLLAIGAIPAAVVVLVGPSLFEIVFGTGWQTAGELARSMTPWFLAAIVVSPLSRVVLVYQRQELKLGYDLVSLGLIPGSLILAVRMGLEVQSAVLMLSVAQLIAYSLYFVLLRRIVGRRAPKSAIGRGDVMADESDVS